MGRAGILQAVGDYLKRGDHHPLAVYGASGSGKSALMARAVEQVRSDNPNAQIVVRFIGATPGSSDGRALLESLCREIPRRYGVDETTIPMDYRELVQEFPKRLALFHYCPYMPSALSYRLHTFVAPASCRLEASATRRAYLWTACSRVSPTYLHIFTSTVSIGS